VSALQIVGAVLLLLVAGALVLGAYRLDTSRQRSGRSVVQRLRDRLVAAGWAAPSAHGAQRPEWRRQVLVALPLVLLLVATAVLVRALRDDSAARGVEVVVVAARTCPIPTSMPFEDVSPTAAHHDAIGCAYALDLVRGKDGDPPVFEPSEPVRHDQAATLVVRLLQRGPKALPEPPAEPDAPAQGPHAPAIGVLADLGVLQDPSATGFEPTAPITNEEMIALLLRALRWSTDEPLEAIDGLHVPDAEGGRSAVTRREQAASMLIHAHAHLQPAAPQDTG
jgi:hypothetical protein